MEHGHSHSNANSSAFKIAFIVTILLVILKAFGGIWADSLALQADAVHSLSDVAALGLAWYADRIQRRPPSPGMSFGWGRTEVLIGLLNAVVLWILAAVFLWQAWFQWRHPVFANAALMAVTAILALITNALLAAAFSHADDFNRRSTFWHLLTDAAGSAGVLIAALVLGLLGWARINSVMTVVIAVLMVWGSWGIIRDTLRVLLESTPAGVSLESITQSLEAVPGVDRIHDLHVWTVGSHQLALACHATMTASTPVSASQDILCQLHDILGTYDIHHTTIQMETANEVHDEPDW